jgi:hypothetical protein
LQLWVEESTPATSVTSLCPNGATRFTSLRSSGTE